VDETSDLDLKPEPFPGIPGVALLRLSGKGGNAVVRKLQETLQPLLAKGTKNFLFDCAGLEFFNSSAFGYLTNLSDSLREAGGRVALCRVPMKVQVAFDYMGLKDFFQFFRDESEAARFFQKSAAPEDPVLPKSQGPLKRAVPGRGPESPPSPVSFALPSWLEDVDKPGPPPLDHLRWSALLQTVLRRLGPKALAGIPRRAIVPPDSPPSLVVRAILRGHQSPEELLGLFDEKTLGMICRLFRLPESGEKEELSQVLIAFVQQTNTISLTHFMEEGPQEPAAEPVAKPDATTPEPSLEITNDTLLRAIERYPFPKLVKTERSGRDYLLKNLANTFGRTQVTPNRAVGRHLTLEVDIDVMERFGILVRLGRSVLGKKSSDLKNAENLLGKVVLLAGIYGRGNLLVILLGDIPKNHGSAFGELRAWMESVGGRTLQR
jgi:anti-sigma B factor antagonist